MIHSRNTREPISTPLHLHGAHGRGWRRKLLYLARPRLISNVLALVALFSIGFV